MPNNTHLKDLLREMQRVARRRPQDRKFDLAYWFDAATELRIFNGMSPDKALECGTSACAAGHYVAAFPRRKIDLLRGFNAIDHLARHFNISFDDACYIFHSSEYPIADRRNPRAVITRIKRVMKGRKI